MIILLVLIGTLLLFGYFVIVKPYSYWKKRGISCETPQFLIGNWGPVLSYKCSQPEYLKYFYDKYPDKRCIPLYQFLTPALIIKDLELIKQITVKDFDSIPEHIVYVSKKDDPLWAKNLFAMPGGQEWKDVRSTLSPAFTKNKLKMMFNLVVDCAQNLTRNLDQDKLVVFEAKDTFSKVTNDIIATTAFGVECDTMKNQNNDLFTMGKQLLYFDGFFQNLKFLIFFISPFLAKLLKIRMVREKPGQFFRKIVKETIMVREKNQIIRPDMVHLMMEARKGKLKNEDQITSEEEMDKVSKSSKLILTDDVITSQAMVFYFGGYDTVSTALSFTVYELALNPDIQDRLFREIEQTSKKCNGMITYDELLEMKYLDMVISESLRKWNPFGSLGRKPIKSLNLPLENEKVLSIDENVICYIPVYAIHRDPKYWLQPDKFDPERFNDNNKSKIKPFTYLPFGAGPRNCIASRFASLAIKTILFHLLYKLEIVPVDKTAIPLKLGISFPDSISAEEYWLGIKPRTAIYVPVYQLMTPVLILRDLELIKRITVKDFVSLYQKITLFILYTNLLNLDIKLWRELRPILSPAYTKSKLKIMFDLVVHSAHEFKSSFPTEKSTTFEAKEAFSKVTNDIIATTAFGVECDTMKNPDNELYRMGKEVLINFGGFSVGLKVLMVFINPIFRKLFNIRFINAKLTHFLRNIVRTTISVREKYDIIRPDIMHLMMEARKGKLKDEEDPTASDAEIERRKSIFTNDVIAAQAMIFYLAGFDTISTLSSFTVYELALNPNIQTKLFNEIRKSLGSNNKIMFEALFETKYLDMVISESLRKWGPFERKPTKPLDFLLENETLKLDERVICYVPVFAIHRDPQHWPDPERFDPERFSDDNKHNIKPFTYLPFGSGPRNCIANRFALMAVKTILVSFLQKFEIVPVSRVRTAIPFKLGIPIFPDIIAADEYWLGLNPRELF